MKHPVQSGLSFRYNPYVGVFLYAGVIRTGLENKLYKMHGTYIKMCWGFNI